MTDALEDRRRALEEDYFRRKDRESLQKLRAAREEEARARGEDVPTMNCPRCDGQLHERTHDDVQIDQCDRCEGIWLDAGEFEQLVRQEAEPSRWFRAFWPGKTKE
ncbi:MAG TPA: zf-TFIIB domain-containing protein [Pyrinomonadaceae bacterium]|nr:zf-TFIIB domain-containing protein [Pyrinomonadaceae bacterium]